VVEVDAVVPAADGVAQHLDRRLPMTDVDTPPSESTLACNAAPPLKASRKRFPPPSRSRG
jgi:hypothetical protein